MMRFGLSDLDELPSLKEFEALAQAALGSDEGIADVQPEDGQGGDAQSAEMSSAVVTDEEALTELEGNAAMEGEMADATLDVSADAPGETMKDTIEDVSGEQEAASEMAATDEPKNSRAASATVGGAKNDAS